MGKNKSLRLAIIITALAVPLPSYAVNISPFFDWLLNLANPNQDDTNPEYVDGCSNTSCVDSPSTTGKWGEVFSIPIIPIHMSLGPDGRVLMYGSGKDGSQGTMEYVVWDRQPSGHHFTTLPNTMPTDTFCAGQSRLASSGDLIMIGGDNGTGENFGNANTTLFSANNLIKNVNYSMVYPRWYPTVTTLPGDEYLVQGGSTNGVLGTGVIVPEIYNPRIGYRSLINARSEFAYGDDFNRWWYPRTWVLPNRKIFTISGPAMYYTDVKNFGQTVPAGELSTENIGATSTAVMYRPGKILQVGGGDKANHVGDSVIASNAASIIDVKGEWPSVRQISPMKNRRHWANSTLLPDGNVLVTGGSEANGAVGEVLSHPVGYEAELWDARTEQWATMTSEKHLRHYHSSALLLPDGSVLSAGTGAPGPKNNLNGQIFYPPYLFDGDGWAKRPVANILDKTLAYGQKLTINVDDSSAIKSITMVKNGVVTHSFNNEQRFRHLPITQKSTKSVTVKIPSSPYQLTPGHYMLFAINEKGTPSIGTIVHLPPKSKNLGWTEQKPLVTNGNFENAGIIDITDVSPAVQALGAVIGEGAARGAIQWQANLVGLSLNNKDQIEVGFGEYMSGKRLGDWYVQNNGVEVQASSHQHMGQVQNGKQFLDLNANGKIWQDIKGLIAGQRYKISFDYAVHEASKVCHQWFWGWCWNQASAKIEIGSLKHPWTAINRGKESWKSYSKEFVASSQVERLSITATQGSKTGGMLVDNVFITPVY